jgi:broad specificity polyphosphatase/5'/3'-nucleotidase SurE
MEPNYKISANVVLDLLQNYNLQKIDSSLVLNINTPNVVLLDDLAYKVTSVGSWGSRNPPQVQKAENGQLTYWTSHRDVYSKNGQNTDINALEENMVSISPISPNFTVDKVKDKTFSLDKK